jgi:hypothetical protein
MARKPAALARELLRNFPKGRRGSKRRRRKSGGGGAGEDGEATAAAETVETVETAETQDKDQDAPDSPGSVDGSQDDNVQDLDIEPSDDEASPAHDTEEAA